MAGLEIQIGADTSELEKGIKDAEKKLKDLANTKLEHIKLGINTKDVNKDIRVVKQELSILKTSLKDSGDSFNKLTPKVANGGNALMQFSRIAQDAPFGIMGIGNNITATAESFGHLVKETGSAGGALKSVASSMLGTGGILLAVSLVTSGLTYMSQNGITVGDIFSKLAGTFDETAKSLSDINKESTKTATEEISTVKALLSVAKDKSLSDEKRLIAVKKLQDEYPAYFGNLTRERILNGEVRDVVNDLSKALRERAMASAISSKLGELAVKRLELEEKREKAILEIKQKQKDLVEKQKGNGSFFINEEGQLRAAEAVYKAIISDIKELDIMSKKYSDRENEATKNSILLLDTKDKKLKTQKTYSTPQVIGVKSELDSAGLAETAGTIMQIAKNVQGAEGIISTSMGNIEQSFNMSGVAISENLKKFNGELSSIVTNGTVNALSGIGEAIGDALVNGGNIIDSIGKTILGSMGSMLKDLGKATIAYGVGLIAVKAAIKNPYLAVAAGVAMVALGSAMSSAVSKSSSSALGGSSSGGGMSSGASYSSPASSSSYSSGSSGMGGGTVVFEISGTSLIGVLNNTLDRNKRLGGS